MAKRDYILSEDADLDAFENRLRNYRIVAGWGFAETGCYVGFPHLLSISCLGDGADLDQLMKDCCDFAYVDLDDIDEEIDAGRIVEIPII